MVPVNAPRATRALCSLPQFSPRNWHTATGRRNTSFDSDGKVTTAISTSNDEVYAIAIQPDGKIVAAGRSLGATYDFAVTRYEGNYTPVATGESYSVLEDNPLSVAVVGLLLTSGGI